MLNTRNDTQTSVVPVDALVGGSLLGPGWDAYLLTPADVEAGLSSSSVALNGVELGVLDQAGATPSLPPLLPAAKTGNAIVLPPLTFGFFVLREAGAAACKG